MNIPKKTILLLLVTCSIVSILLGIRLGHKYEFQKNEYSIGIYTGSNPFNMINTDNIVNPVLSSKDVKDISADFVADPFMLNVNNTWYMFFEVFNADSRKGEIGLATSDDGIRWNYQKIVLKEPFHLSYPYVFEWKGEYYLVPESSADYSIRLYKAIDFPYEWRYVGELLKGIFTDPSVIHYNNRWFLFAESGKKNDYLRLFYSTNLLGPWREHPKSPIVKGNPHIARPGGRIKIIDNKLYRFTQDDFPTYGRQLRVFEIKALSEVEYQENEIQESPIFKASGVGWNADGMHNVDLHQIDQKRWIACVDGLKLRVTFRKRH